MKPSERLEKVKEVLGIGCVSLAKSAGLPRTQISDLIRTDAKTMPFKVARAISKTFPTISEEWLLTGEGEMIMETSTQDTKKEPSSEDSMKKIVNELLVTISMMQEQMQTAIQLLEATNRRADEQQKRNEESHSEFLAVLKMMRSMGVTFAPMSAHEGMAAESTPNEHK